MSTSMSTYMYKFIGIVYPRVYEIWLQLKIVGLSKITYIHHVSHNSDIIVKDGVKNHLCYMDLEIKSLYLQWVFQIHVAQMVLDSTLGLVPT